jgi:hypothetical protein
VKANEFVKKHGWGSLLIAKTLPKFNRYKYVIFYADEIDFSNEFHAARKSYMFDVAEVKRFVESHELVEKYKKGRGIRFRIRWGQFRYGDTKEYNDRLKQAIADMESCMEVNDGS